MLKLEKSRKNSDINICLRQPKRLLDRYFLSALAGAIGLHLFAAILFHVRLFSFGQIETLLPTTRAHAHYIKGSTDDHDAIVMAQINMQGRLTPAHLSPTLSTPDYQTLSAPTILKPIEALSMSKSNLFEHLESNREHDDFSNLNLPTFYPPLKINVTNLPEDLKFTILTKEDSQLFVSRKIPEKNLKQFRLTYSVQIDSNGQVFWYHLEENTQNKSQMLLAEKFLKMMHFPIKSNEFVQNGYIEFIFSSGDA